MSNNYVTNYIPDKKTNTKSKRYTKEEKEKVKCFDSQDEVPYYHPVDCIWRSKLVSRDFKVICSNDLIGVQFELEDKYFNEVKEEAEIIAHTCEHSKGCGLGKNAYRNKYSIPFGNGFAELKISTESNEYKGILIFNPNTCFEEDNNFNEIPLTNVTFLKMIFVRSRYCYLLKVDLTRDYLQTESDLIGYSCENRADHYYIHETDCLYDRNEQHHNKKYKKVNGLKTEKKSVEYDTTRIEQSEYWDKTGYFSASEMVYNFLVSAPIMYIASPTDNPNFSNTNNSFYERHKKIIDGGALYSNPCDFLDDSFIPRKTKEILDNPNTIYPRYKETKINNGKAKVLNKYHYDPESRGRIIHDYWDEKIIEKIPITHEMVEAFIKILSPWEKLFNNILPFEKMKFESEQAATNNTFNNNISLSNFWNRILLKFGKK